MPCSQKGSEEVFHRTPHPNNHITQVHDGAEEAPSCQGPDELPAGKGKFVFFFAGPGVFTLPGVNVLGVQALPEPRAFLGGKNSEDWLL